MEQRQLKHLACIMDGNRRWAKRKGWMPWLGHRQGVQTVKTVVDFCLENNIPYLSLYAFSLENFNRSKEEIEYLFDMMLERSEEILQEYIAKGVRVRFIGDRSLFPAKIVPVCKEMEERTAHLSKLHVSFLLCYGSRQEIMSGIKQLIAQVKAGVIAEEQVTPDLLDQYLWTHGVPEPDMIMRTGGVKRLSNFLLYQAAYAEFYFIDQLWPELTTHDLEKAVAYFYACQRNFGS